VDRRPVELLSARYGACRQFQSQSEKRVGREVPGELLDRQSTTSPENHSS